MSRRIETQIETTIPNVFVQVSTSHHAERNAFFSSVYRVKIQDGFVRFSVMEDRFTSAQESVIRFSQKRLEERHNEFVDSLDLEALKTWGAQYIDR